MKKYLFIVGASVLQLPAIVKAKEMGLRVAVADYNPKAVGIEFADAFYEASTIDADAVTAAAKDFKANGIMTLATDMPMRSVAAAAQKLGLPSISTETALKATDKGEMIKAFKEHRVESPWFFIVEDEIQFNKILENVDYPCIIKPTDNAGSKGVVLVKKQEEALSAYLYSKENSRHGAVIVEEYLQGSEVSVEIMVLEGQPHVLAVTDKITTGPPHFVEMGHSQPSRLPEKDLESIRDLAQRAVAAIGIMSGPAHVEIMLTAKGPKMIELGARMGGDCISTHLVPLSTGVDMVKAAIQIALGEKPDIRPTLNKGSAIRFLEAQSGILSEVKGLEDAEKISGVVEITVTKGPGDILGEIKSSNDRLGFVIAQGNNAKEALEICEKASSLIRIMLVR